jgi:hypothetical protein
MNGIDYVNWPRLVPLTDVIDYTGRGSGSTKRGRGMPFFHGGKRKPFLPHNAYNSGQKDELDNKERLD